jgi:Uma2 family endonuclease
MVIQSTQTYTLAEFEQFLTHEAERDRNYELIRGAIVEKAMPTDVHAFIVGLLIYYLTHFAKQHGLGLPGPERRFAFPGDTQNSRQPDVSQILDPAVPFVDRGPMRVIPDVVAEVMSPDDSIEGLREKAQFYTEKGVRLTWLIFPRQQIVEVYRPGQAIEMLSIKDTLEGYDVLPGFSMAVVEFFPENRGG